MENRSIWTSLQRQATGFPPIQEDLAVDIAIIGGGITGMVAAFELTKQNKKVALIESNQIGWGTTGFSTGNLYIPVQPYYQNIKNKFNTHTANLIIEARKDAIDYLEDTVQDNKIDCHFFRRPWFMYTNQEKNIRELENEFEILKNAKLSVNYAGNFDLPFKIKKAIVLENQARFNPLSFVTQLASIVEEKGGLIFENTPIESIEEKNGQVVVTTATGKVSAQQVVIATHTPKGVHRVQFYLGPYRSYAVAVKLNSEYPRGHYWDLDSPGYITSTHSVESNNLDMLIVSGQHHKVGQCTNHLENYQRIQHYIKENYEAKEQYRWSAQHYQAADDMPFIGYGHRKTKNIFIATGFFADGLTYGTVAARLLVDLISGVDNPLIHLFDPNRSTLAASAKKLIKENTNVFYQYAKDLPFNVEAKQITDIKPGEGKTVEIGGEKCAAYRDNNNKLHVISAVCTHMKCIVNWNNAENTWDCPCHGSRFSIEGKVIEGPAYEDLSKKDANEE